MKNGLAKIPDARDLERAYAHLQAKMPPQISELALYSQWARVDPRLAEIWVQAALLKWRKINPIEFHEALKLQPWPAAAAVLLEFVERAVATLPEELSIYIKWKALVTAGFKIVNWQQFFIGQRRIAGQAMVDDARLSLQEYKKWGYLSREILFNKQQLPGGRYSSARRGRAGAGTHGIAPETRQEILKDILKNEHRITTETYWNAIGKCISRRQAERDLLFAAGLRPIGKTRSRVFVKRAGTRPQES